LYVSKPQMLDKDAVFLATGQPQTAQSGSSLSV
jgi:hypothetical protein